MVHYLTPTLTDRHEVVLSVSAGKLGLDARVVDAEVVRLPGGTQEAWRYAY